MVIRNFVTPALLMGLAVWCSPSFAGTIAVNHYDDNWGYDASMSWSILGAEAPGAGGTKTLQAMSFVAPVSGSTMEVWLTLAWVSGWKRAAVEIVQGDEDQPGNTGASGSHWVYSDELPSVSDPHPLTPVHFSWEFPTIAGQKYWIIVGPGVQAGQPEDSYLLWYWNKIGDTGQRAVGESSTGPWTVYENSTQAAFRVDIVPEPASLTLLAGGGLCIAWHLLRRRNGPRRFK